MRILQVLNSLTFRFIARYVIVLVTTVSLVLCLLYAFFSYNYFSDLRDSVVEELDTFEAVFRGQSLEGVKQYIDDQGAVPASTSFSYLVTDAAGQKLAGDLPSAPRYREFVDGWLSFQLSLLQSEHASEVDFLARSRELDSGLTVMVARSFADAVESGGLVFDTLVRAMIATLMLGIIGGFFTASFALRRMEQFGQRLSRIVREKGGTERMPLEGEEGYLRELTLLTNRMLDQMSVLMQGVRQVSDNIAHDLRTPLTRIRNQLDQLRSGLDPQRQQAVDRVIEECDELLSSFNALLRISALESGSKSSPDAELDLAALLGDVAELYEPLANDKGISLAFYSPAQLSLCGDGDLLFQMFANLLDNAIKYTPEGGQIELRLHSALTGGARVEISDTGRGIPAADRQHVFRRFYRLESSRGKEPGHGLGLSLVQAIVQYHQGTISLANNNPGLRVVVSLP